jgi:hypothetical protein
MPVWDIEKRKRIQKDKEATAQQTLPQIKDFLLAFAEQHNANIDKLSHK